MRQHLEGQDYIGLRHEVDTLRRKIEEMESGHFRPDITARASRWGRLSGKSASAWLAVVVVALLAVFGLDAQNKATSLFIDQTGKVGINTTTPDKTLDVNGDAVFRQPVTVDALTVNKDAVIGKQLRGASGTLDVAGPTTMAGTTTLNSDLRLGNSDVYFTKTDHDHTALGNTTGWAAIENSTNYNSLMVLGRMVKVSDKKDERREITLWDRVGIGKVSPQTPLDVKGEIRGKPWYSAEYEWKQGEQPVQMARVDRTVCFLTLVSGQLYGGGEVVQITPQNKAGGAVNYWELSGRSGTKDVRARARCIGTPDDQTW